MKTEIEVLVEADLEGANAVVGQPGIGHVGKLVADHLVDELGAELIAEVYSPHLPPEVLVDSGRSRKTTVRVHYAEDEGVVVVTSDYIATDNEGHYAIADVLMNFLQENGVADVFTLGGLDVSEDEPEEAEGGLEERMQEGWRTGGIGPELKDPKVYGVVNDLEFMDELKASGVRFNPEAEFGGVATVPGVLLNLGERRGVRVGYLMGEVSGSHLVNPITGEAMVNALENLLDVTVDKSGLEDRSIDLEDIAMHMVEGKPSF